MARLGQIVFTRFNGKLLPAMVTEIDKAGNACLQLFGLDSLVIIRDVPPAGDDVDTGMMKEDRKFSEILDEE